MASLDSKVATAGISISSDVIELRNQFDKVIEETYSRCQTRIEYAPEIHSWVVVVEHPPNDTILTIMAGNTKVRFREFSLEHFMASSEELRQKTAVHYLPDQI